MMCDLTPLFRTPITILRGEAEIALSKPRTVEEYRKVLESSLEEFDQISAMIEKLLFLARVENPNETVNYSRVDINKLFKDSYDVYEGIAEVQGVKLSYQGGGFVKADLALIRRAMSNLISNALKHTSQGGTINLQVQIDEVDKICQISVNDTGCGILAEHLPHLFDRFYRVDSSRSQNTGGTGLGLAIVKSIMNLHHGKVIVSSEMNKGTRVTLIFPT
jgi:two-component system heavy metal sensor histidine kinase CusS